jgi:hypothetical protein
MSTFWNDKVGWEIFLAKNLHKKKIVCNFPSLSLLHVNILIHR